MGCGKIDYDTEGGVTDKRAKDPGLWEVGTESTSRAVRQNFLQ